MAELLCLLEYSPPVLRQVSESTHILVVEVDHKDPLGGEMPSD